MLGEKSIEVRDFSLQNPQINCLWLIPDLRGDQPRELWHFQW
jgi:hypothetical protein